MLFWVHLRWGISRVLYFRGESAWVIKIWKSLANIISMVYFNVLICVGGWSEFNDQEILWLRNSFEKRLLEWLYKCEWRRKISTKLTWIARRWSLCVGWGALIAVSENTTSHKCLFAGYRKEKRNITTVITRHNHKLHCLLSIGGFSYFDYFQFRSVSHSVRFGFAENVFKMTSEVPQWLNEKFFEKVLRTAQGDKSLTVR